MARYSFHRRTLAAAGASLLLPYVFPAIAADAAPRLPDLASYGCAEIAGAVPAQVVHKGQIIEGRYHEWHEIFVDVQESRRLACISLVAPRAEQLSASAARQFLSASLGLGRRAEDARARAQDSGAQELAEPDNVIPEPPRRVEATAQNDAERGAEAKPSEEVPPLPASKEAPPEGTAAQPSSRERVNSLRYESPAQVGVEDRQAVSNTLIYPWNTIGYLSVTYPNGQSFRCTATLVSPYVVLTAGHCVHNKNRGGYVSQVRFYPAQYQITLGDNTPRRPYAKSDFALVLTTEAWIQISDRESLPVTEYRHDLAAVQFRTPFTFTTTFMPIVYGSTAPSAIGSGYPGSVNGLSNHGQWWDEGADTSSNFMRANHVKRYAIDGSGGNSGGPFFITDAATGQSSLVGVLSYADDQGDNAGGPWYDNWNRALLTSWLTWTPAAAVTSNVSGLRVPGVFSSNHPSFFSYLRFYNGDLAAGSVEVTISDGNTGQPLATWTSGTIAASAMLQVGMRAIESQVSLPAIKPDFYSLSIRPTFTGYFQHVLHEPSVRSLTNVTSCDSGSGAQSGLVIGVHSTRLAGYPSSIVVHNTSTNAANVSLGVYDARNGNLLGTYQSGPIPANGQKVFSAATLQANSSPAFEPAEIDQAHYIVKPMGGLFTGYLQHLVHNEAVNTIADVTALCRLAP